MVIGLKVVIPLIFALIQSVGFIRPPHYVTATTPLNLEVRVERAAHNRFLRVEALVSEGEFTVVRASEESLDGLNAMIVYRFEWKPLDEGVYLLRALVIAGDGTVLGIATTTLEVLGDPIQ